MRNSFDTRIVKVLAEKHGFSTRYIKQILSGDRNPIIADQIRKQYKVLNIIIAEEINKTIKKNN